MNYFFGALLRAISLAGKFLFLAFAADHMDPNEFGRIGIVMAISLLVVGVSGLEGYQTLLRKITQGDNVVSANSKSFYLAFSFLGAFFSFFISIVVFKVYGWGSGFAILCALVVAVDHLNIELCRVLIAEGRSVLSIGTLAMRTGAWALAVPLFYYLNSSDGFVSAQYVVVCWGVASGAGLISFYAVRSRYRLNGLRWSYFRNEYMSIIRSAPRWVAIVVSWRFLESGARVLAGLLVSEAAAGRITLLSTIASFSLVAVKSVVEPTYFSKVLKKGVEGDAALTRFSKVVWVVAPALGLAACAALLIYTQVVSRVSFSIFDYLAFCLINIGYVVMCFSQVDHFKLYRVGKDRAILSSALISLLVMVVLSVPLGWMFGELGIVVGAVFGSFFLFLTKRKFASMPS